MIYFDSEFVLLNQGKLITFLFIEKETQEKVVILLNQ